MSNIWLYLVLFVFSIQSFAFSYRYFGVARSFSLLSHGLVELHIEYLNDEHHPYLRSETLEPAVITFLSTSLEDYCDAYWISFRYLDPTTQMTCSSYCQAVTITLKVELDPFEDYQKSISFMIVNNYESTLT